MPSTICRLDALSSLSRTLRNLPILWLILAVLLLAVPSWPQQALRPEARRDIPPSEPASRQTPAQNPAPGEPPVTLPAGTQLALVLTHPLDSKTMHRGDTVFAETTAPVPVDDQVVIPVGASVQGKVERLTRQGRSGACASGRFGSGHGDWPRRPHHGDNQLRWNDHDLQHPQGRGHWSHYGYGRGDRCVRHPASAQPSFLCGRGSPAGHDSAASREGCGASAIGSDAIGGG